MAVVHIVLLLILAICSTWSFSVRPSISSMVSTAARTSSNAFSHTVCLPRSFSERGRRTRVEMNFFGDAVRFFTNLNKEASARHILMTGPDATSKLQVLKQELEEVPNLEPAFAELAAKVSECPSASRGGNLGTFKPGMMVKEFDQVCFEKELGKVHGPIQTQFGSHLILITRRYEGEKDKK